MTRGSQAFGITTASFPPVYPGTLPANRDPGHYDPVWPPGLPDASISLSWWYDWWPIEFPPDDDQLTVDTYARWMGEHNGAFGTATHAWVVWADNRRSSVRNAHFSQRPQSDVRIARIPWRVPGHVRFNLWRRQP